MAEERQPNAAAEGQQPGENGAEAPAAPKKKKKKKKISKLALFFWLIILTIGTAVGLHFSGLWDGRPLFWSLIPQVPYVGESLAKFFNIPAQYSLTANERRTLELTDWQKRLDARERALTSLDLTLDNLSHDIRRESVNLRAREAAFASNSGNPDGDAPTETEQELMNQVARTYQDMSARNAAAIVEQLRDGLAVDLLMKLPNDARASILGKVKPTKAARLTELMSRPRR